MFGHDFKELSAFTNVGFQSTQALMTSGNKQHLGFHGPRAFAQVLPPKKSTRKIHLSQSHHWRSKQLCGTISRQRIGMFFLFRNWWVLAESTHQGI